ncbi:MAG TPA: hypothetical protein DCK95_12240 [Anaerolineaceae bacterium]|nr:hypothetical protein [Anaerolineaceae bacterium]
MSALTDFRKMKDAYFLSDPQSPLTKQQKHDFKGLHYFPENPALRFVLKIEPFAEKETVSIQTSKGDIRSYVRFGEINFAVETRQVRLTVYETEHGFFLPFVDALVGKETYPAGRYLEIEDQGDSTFLVDFNMAYNPYCAYNDRWSCPLTPLENHLSVAIRAGEKLFSVH